LSINADAPTETLLMSTYRPGHCLTLSHLAQTGHRQLRLDRKAEDVERLLKPRSPGKFDLLGGSPPAQGES
jgi:hypothetical protein